jgi:Retrotransposon gag protein/Zinc knuckle
MKFTNRNVRPGKEVQVWHTDIDETDVSTSNEVRHSLVRQRQRQRQPSFINPTTSTIVPPSAPPVIVSPQSFPSQTITVSMPAIPKPFTGLPGEDAEEWLDSYELICQANGWTDENMKLNKVIGSFSGQAQSWYSSFIRKGKNWNEFKKDFLATFGTQNPSMFYYSQLISRMRQPTESPRTFALDMRRLATKANMTDINNLVAIILRNLNDSRLYGSLYHRKFQNFEEFLQKLAIFAEGQQFIQNQSTELAPVFFLQRGQDNRRFGSRFVQKNRNPIRNNNNDTFNCFNCGKTGHYARDCRSQSFNNHNNRFKQSNFRGGWTSNRPPNRNVQDIHVSHTNQK